VVIAIVAQALWNLGRKAVKNWLTGILGLLVLTLYFRGVNILVLLLAAGAGCHGRGKPLPDKTPARPRVLAATGGSGSFGPVPSRSACRFLFLNFLKIGATAVWQRLCPAGVPARRLRPGPRLADGPGN